ncbi:MAG: NfeD family protein [Clostridia bacterium]|nr:NfeD family protein [Clostridia bacterium]
MEWIWLCLMIALVVLELVTTQIICVWFALGAMVTSILTAIFGDMGYGIVWQIVTFVIVSVALLLATRPLVKRLLNKRTENQKTNLELYIDKEAIVTEDISNIKGEGAVKINGIVWSAKSKDGEDISSGEIVIFKEIIGNKAIVERKGE